MFRPSMTAQIAAQAAVCAHLGTDLTLARSKGLNIRWRGMESGDHVVTVGTIPECCMGIL